MYCSQGVHDLSSELCDTGSSFLFMLADTVALDVLELHHLLLILLALTQTFTWVIILQGRRDESILVD